MVIILLYFSSVVCMYLVTLWFLAIIEIPYFFY